MTAEGDADINIVLRLPESSVGLCFGPYFSNLPTVDNFSPDPNQEFLSLGGLVMSQSSESFDGLVSVELLSRRWLTENAFEIELTRPASFNFKPGQTIAFHHKSIKRYYSLISTPSHATLELCVHRVKEGAFSSILASADIGSVFELSGPHGYFTYKPSTRSAVFVATGIGIAPFISMARSGVAGFIVFHEVDAIEELLYQPELRHVALNYHPCITQGQDEDISMTELFCGKIYDCITKSLAESSYDFYLCGHREMIQEVTRLVDRRYPDSFVYTEVFF